MHPVYKIRHQMGIQQHQNQRRRWMESRVPNTPRPLWTPCNVLWTHKFPHNISSDDEWNLQDGSGSRMAISIHGRHRYPHKTPQWRNGTTTRMATQTINSPSTRKTGDTRPIPQTRKMQIPKTRNRVLRCNHRKWSPQNEPKETRKHQKLGGTQ